MMYSKYAKCGSVVEGADTVLLLVLRKSKCRLDRGNFLSNVCWLCKFNFTLKMLQFSCSISYSKEESSEIIIKPVSSLR